ncbi:helix-turn-helix domain-containing protein (plasmid) [Acinetobacter johnsonii]|uniref:Antitoxin HipB n=1 Tax=Acinetobacter johnsonii TaxID=40214 RepID=A0A1R7QHW7_ACIJO|nr:helix-turn-helix transcriptional regulator [Acinetobacter johnsonii]SJX23853.1 antitoxin HipB [Acinetobacter johnsonii]
MASRKEIGEKIKLARRNLGYTQKTVSERSGVHKTTISEIENGHFTGSYDLFEKVLSCVGLQFDVVAKERRFPHWDEIESLFKEDDDE